MKKLLFSTLIALLFGGLAPLRAQDLSQMAKEQIENNVKLPIFATLPDSALLERYNLDKVVMKFPVRANGRIIVSEMTFLNPTISRINDLFIYALRKVKLPKDAARTKKVLTVEVQLAFEYLYMCKKNKGIGYTTENVKPNNRSKIDFYEREIGKTLEGGGDYFSKRSGAAVSTEYTKYKLEPTIDGVPLFRVTLVKLK